VSKGPKSIIVTVTDEMLGNIDQVADHLTAKGMKIDQVMPITGVISGSCAATKMHALEKVAGVMSVEEEATAHLPPSDSTLQ
jgi:hypothetical protein